MCFLSSAANGAEEFYTLHNNAARSEGIEEARKLDAKTLEAWVGHPHLTVIPNMKGETFDDKVNRAVEAVAKTVGEEEFGAVYNKFLIEERKVYLIQLNSPRDILSRFQISRRHFCLMMILNTLKTS